MFSTIVEVASTFPAITEEDLTMLREVRAMAESEQFEDMQGIYEVSKSYGIVHGDFRTGKYGRLLSTLLHVSALTMGSKRPPDLTLDQILIALPFFPDFEIHLTYPSSPTLCNTHPCLGQHNVASEATTRASTTNHQPRRVREQGQ